MDDPVKSELLSAYLDGELTVAERAEVERLLAADPAARQTLDELRALRAALRALPPRKLGEDLSQQVLREAQRRRLTEGEQAGREAIAPSVPLSRSILRRFVNRRMIVWLALTAAVVVMIKLNEGQRQVPPADRGREIAASAPADHVRSAHGPLPPSSIAAAPDDSTRPLRKAAAAVEKPAKSAPPAAVAKAESPSQQSAGEYSVRNRAGEKGQLGGRGQPPAKAGQAAGKAPAGMNAQRQKDEKQQATPLLIVRCDISPEAAESEAFDKLLNANGVAWRQDRRRGATLPNAANKQAAATGDVFVRAEATPAQIKAVLAGLEAQPDVFLAVSIKQTQDAASADAYAYEESHPAAEQSKSPARSDRRQEAAKKSGPAKAAEGETAADSDAGGQTSSAPAELPLAPMPQSKLPDGQQQTNPPAKANRQQPAQSPRQQAGQQLPRQQVLFVVRVIARSQQAPASPPAAAKEQK